MPGLADMHVHYNDPGVAGQLIANGITHVRHMWGAPHQLALNQKVRAGEFPGPWIASTSPIIDGLGTHGQTAWPGSVLLTDPAKAEPLVKQYAQRGYRQIKAYQWLKPEVLRALGDAARAAGLRVVGHCPEGMSFEDAIDAGMSCFEHLTGVGRGHLTGGREFPDLRDPISRRGSPETVGLLAHHLDADAIKRLADRMAREDVWTCPTLVVWQKQVQVPEEALTDPALKYESPGTAKGWEMALRGRHAQLPIPVNEWVGLARARDAALAGVVRTLHAAGAPLLLGTDAPNPFVVFGFGLHQELGNLVRAGLSPFEALRCGTSNGARFLGEADEWGTLAVGKQADLLFARDNPLEGVATLRQPAAMLVNGYYFDRQALDGLLEARAAQFSAPTPPPDDPPVFQGEAAKAGATFTERTAGRVTGRMRVRRQALADGHSKIEEAVAGRVGSLPFQKTTLVVVDAEQAVVRAESTTTSWLGTERTEVERTATGYRARVEAIDGARSESTLETDSLLPSERVSATALAACLASGGQSALRLLSVDDEAIQIVTAEAADGADGSRQLSVNRSGTVTTQTYDVGADGTLRKLAGTTWMQPVELTADPPG
jgi:hypothetical protein